MHLFFKTGLFQSSGIAATDSNWLNTIVSGETRLFLRRLNNKDGSPSGPADKVTDCGINVHFMNLDIFNSFICHYICTYTSYIIIFEVFVKGISLFILFC